MTSAQARRAFWVYLLVFFCVALGATRMKPARMKPSNIPLAPAKMRKARSLSLPIAYNHEPKSADDRPSSSMVIAPSILSAAAGRLKANRQRCNAADVGDRLPSLCVSHQGLEP